MKTKFAFTAAFLLASAAAASADQAGYTFATQDGTAYCDGVVIHCSRIWSSRFCSSSVLMSLINRFAAGSILPHKAMESLLCNAAGELTRDGDKSSARTFRSPSLEMTQTDLDLGANGRCSNKTQPKRPRYTSRRARQSGSVRLDRYG